MIGVFSYGVGNPAAVVRMCESIGIEASLIHPGQNTDCFSRIVLPGVGHIDACINALHESGAWESVNSFFHEQKGPILGICVGAQVLGRSSEEGSLSGLGFIPMKSKKLVVDSLQIPHMGWAETSWQPPIIEPLISATRFYYSHSYVLVPDENSIQMATFEYGQLQTGAVLSNQVVAVQFHPEKSHRHGKRFFEWFSGWTP